MPGRRAPLGLVLPLLLTMGAPEAALAVQPYEGLWSKSKQTCRTDEDGVERLEITGNRLFWYESRCEGRIAPAGRNAWSARLSCQGEGERWSATTRLVLTTPDRLILENAPVGPGKRHSYARCARPPL